MKKSFLSLFIAVIASFTAVCAQAAETASQAVVLKVTGDVKAALPGKAPAAVQVGDQLPQGTVIQTDKNSAVDLQVFSGTTATIQSESKVDISKLSLTTSNGQVTKQSAELDLKVGTVVSTLDPAKKSINDYSIRTPRGVAAARGTVYTVEASPNGVVRTFVARGTVTFTNAAGQTVVVKNNQVVTVSADGTISDPVEATADQKQAAKDAFKEEPGDRAIDITISPSN